MGPGGEAGGADEQLPLPLTGPVRGAEAAPPVRGLQKRGVGGDPAPPRPAGEYILPVMAAAAHGPPDPEPRTRADFLRYFVPLTLDPNTAGCFLSLSGGTHARSVRKCRKYPPHPDRFDHLPQVLCQQALTGRCYWEARVEVMMVAVGVTYKSIARKASGGDASLGMNDKSWVLLCYCPGFTFLHDDQYTELSGPECSRVGVYLDQAAGKLEFYAVSDAGCLTLLHRVQTVFAEPVYPGFYLSGGFDMMEPGFYGSSVELCEP
ncbi:stonustoxin subunit beta-like isoform X3 [Lepisosteus oculatus]|uniref:stonustoxin subunit beta-like isoform X3 n=1 Tax=Lepisosteus oculatus TaxID=7918 RepID=UPI00371FED8A